MPPPTGAPKVLVSFFFFYLRLQLLTKPLDLALLLVIGLGFQAVNAKPIFRIDTRARRDCPMPTQNGIHNLVSSTTIHPADPTPREYLGVIGKLFVPARKIL
jgi:hypothetical protein